jgi:hypothetical protein
MGKLCASCSVGYAATPDGQCGQCSNLGLNIALTVLIGIAVLIVVPGLA